MLSEMVIRNDKRAAGTAGNAGYMIWILLKKELLEQLRRGQLLTVVIVFLFFGILSPAAAQFTPLLLEKLGESQQIMITVPEPGIIDAYAQYIKNFTQLVPLILIFITMGGIAKEKEKGTLVFLLVKPVSRASMMAAKALASVIATTIGLAVGILSFILYSLLIFGPFDTVSFIAGNGLILLYFITLVIVVQALNTGFSRPSQAGIAALAVWLLSVIMQALPKVGTFSFTRLGTLAQGIFIGGEFAWEPVIASVVLMAAASLFGYLRFRNWE